MSQNDGNTHSFLELVAEHEEKLHLELEHAERRAESVIDAAREKARQIMDECQQALLRELAEINDKTEAACKYERDAVLQETEKRMALHRSELAPYTSDAVRAVLDMVIPRIADTEGGR